MQPTPIVTFTEAQLNERAASRPAGYRDAVLAKAWRVNGAWEIRREDIEAIRKRFVPQPITLRELLTNFKDAISTWKEAGYPVADEGAFHRRLTVCRSCEEWKDGLISTCRKCGCTKLKLWLETTSCPLKKW